MLKISKESVAKRGLLDAIEMNSSKSSRELKSFRVFSRQSNKSPKLNSPLKKLIKKPKYGSLLISSEANNNLKLGKQPKKKQGSQRKRLSKATHPNPYIRKILKQSIQKLKLLLSAHFRTKKRIKESAKVKKLKTSPSRQAKKLLFKAKCPRPKTRLLKRKRETREKDLPVPFETEDLQQKLENSALAIQQWWRKVLCSRKHTVYTEEASENEFIFETHLRIMIDSQEYSSNCSSFSYYKEEAEEVIDTEIEEFFKLVKFVHREKEVNPSFGFIADLIDCVKSEINSEEFLDRINTPVAQKVLSHLQTFQPALTETKELPHTDRIIHMDILKSLKEKQNPAQLFSRDVYIDMIFDCINEAFTHVQPFALTVLPFYSQGHTQVLGENSVEDVFSKTQVLLQNWWQVKAGRVHTEKDKNSLETRMSKMLAMSIVEGDLEWNNFQDEQQQVTNDISEDIMHNLFQEVLRIL